MSRTPSKPPKWEDTTSYSKTESRGQTPPRTWTMTTPDLTIVVTRKHWDVRAEAWYVECHQVGLEGRGITAASADEAKVKAMSVVKDRIMRLSNDLKDIVT
jgi:hypothetical protein